ncbi:MAG: Lrp/AsnC family transcriptional regulator [Methylobacteriaceae bacterium]|nr:Lrp/AsnC family transcriptional regulator [Methylobacteriaceae bacterium]
MPASELDRHERALLRELQRDARQSVGELADTIGLSTSPTWRRLKGLEERRVIRGYVARVDEAALGYGQTVFANVTLAKHDRAEMQAFEQALIERPEVLEFFSMTGSFDYLLRVVVGSTADYERFLQEVVFTSPAVQHVSSNFALRELKHTTAVPV